MKQFFVNFLAKIVLVIVLLHTFIPHPHADELTINEHVILHQKNNSVLDFLKVFFHESNDESLDNLLLADYTIKDTVDLTPLLVDNSYNVLNRKVDKINLLSNNQIDLVNNFIVIHNGVRGSPLV